MDARRKMNLLAANGEGGADRRRTGRDSRPMLSKEERNQVQAQRVAAEEKRHQEFVISFQRLRGLDPAVEEQDEEATIEWLEVATNLVDAFRETRELFPSDSKKKFMGVLSRKWRRKGGDELDIETRAGQMASRLERRMGTFSFFVEASKRREIDLIPWRFR